MSMMGVRELKVHIGWQYTHLKWIKQVQFVFIFDGIGYADIIQRITLSIEIEN